MRVSVLEESYEQFLEQLSDLGFDMRLQLILSRVEQRLWWKARPWPTHNLQRMLKVQKERSESKEFHIKLLRWKVSELVEEKRSCSALAVERDDTPVTASKLQKKVERLQGELGSSMVSITELKAQLSNTNKLKLKVPEQSQTIGEQSKSLEELEKGKAQVEERLTTARTDLQSQEHQAREAQQQLTTLRQTLAQLTHSEKEVVGWRMVVSQMLGLEVTALVVSQMLGLEVTALVVSQMLGLKVTALVVSQMLGLEVTALVVSQMLGLSYPPP
ncbi:coiled-coil domain-containing protein 170-like [Oncorhynchus nerka]|uniref:coiled-coil domain-containing protein 170-like n=1 Tax=Oncorhynchus nerka TaxID=8023 RepID=UPI0031B87AA0